MLDEKNPSTDNSNDNTPKPDPETLHVTDPQDNMEGPISSLMHETGKPFDSDKSKAEADDKKESGF